MVSVSTPEPLATWLWMVKKACDADETRTRVERVWSAYGASLCESARSMLSQSGPRCMRGAKGAQRRPSFEHRGAHLLWQHKQHPGLSAMNGQGRAPDTLDEQRALANDAALREHPT